MLTPEPVAAIGWQDVWSNYDQRRKAKAGNGLNDVAYAAAVEANEQEPFVQVVAAE